MLIPCTNANNCPLVLVPIAVLSSISYPVDNIHCTSSTSFSFLQPNNRQHLNAAKAKLCCSTYARPTSTSFYPPNSWKHLNAVQYLFPPQVQAPVSCSPIADNIWMPLWLPNACPRTKSRSGLACLHKIAPFHCVLLNDSLMANCILDLHSDVCKRMFIVYVI